MRDTNSGAKRTKARLSAEGIVSTGADEVRAILAAYREVKDASWPDLHPGMTKRAARWPVLAEADLHAELEGYLREASEPSCPVRVFWKLGPRFIFGGCNAHFAKDAGFGSPAALLGLDDFNPKMPWQAQAAKYRADDKEVYERGTAKLDILERQTSAAGVTVFVLVGKAPIRMAAQVIGVLGMYELLDEKAAQKLFFERSRGPSKA
jgi:hypothetical protein